MQNLETKPTTLLFDLETTPLDAQKTDIHCIVTLDYETGETTRYNDIGGDQPIVRAVQYLELADTIIGHNIIGFDIPVIKKIYPWFKPQGRIIDTFVNTIASGKSCMSRRRLVKIGFEILNQRDKATNNTRKHMSLDY